MLSKMELIIGTISIPIGSMGMVYLPTWIVDFLWQM